MSKRLFAEAVRYLEQGYPVVAVTGKRPVVPWLAYCGRMPDRADLAKMMRRPEVTGVALVIGAALWQRHANYWVLDIEARHRDVAEQWLERSLPGWRDGRVVETGSGGLHLHLLGPAPVRTRPCAFGDVKGERSVAVLPPSLHPRGFYRWLHEGQPQALEPDRLPAPPAARGPARGPAYAALAESEPIPEGQRHQVLLSLGGLLRRAGLSAADVAEALRAVNHRRCRPPLPDAEVDELAASLGRYAPVGAGAAHAGTAARPRNREVQGSGEAAAGAEAAEMDPAAVDRLLQGLPAYPRAASPAPKGGNRPQAYAFRGPAELLSVDHRVDWVWDGYLPRGAVAVLAGREKTGKSTLLWSLVSAVTAGRPFCGRDTAATPVVVLTEESAPAVAEKAERFRISAEAPLSVLTRDGAGLRRDWVDVVAAAGQEAARIGAGLIVVDTLAWWAALPPDAENSAGAMTAALWPLLSLAVNGPAVLAVHHLSKASGELRGSTAIGATADVVITVSRDTKLPSRRLLAVVGRYSGLADEPEVIELGEDDEFRSIGGYAEATLAAVAERVRDLLAETRGGLSVGDVARRLRLAERTVRRAIAWLGDDVAEVRAADDRRRRRYRLAADVNAGGLPLLPVVAPGGVAAE
jgi:DNA-binding transcriptional ArsR family regulator